MRRRAAFFVMIALMAGGLFGTASSSLADPALVRFSVLGDISASSNAAGVLSAIAARNDDLTLAVGDLSYGTTGQEQAWCDFVTARVGAGYPFELIAGNHESNGINGNINDFSACLPNQLPGLIGTYGRQWYVDVPAETPLVRYVMISPALTYPDGAWSYAPGSPRYQWTAAAIDGARAAGIPWVVVGMHKPCLNLGPYSCETGAADISDLLVSKRVDLVVNGHEHLYQRTKQLRLGAGCVGIVPGSYNAACVADADSDLVQGAGTVTATIGTGGHSLRDVNAADPEAPYFAASSGLNQNPTYGALGVSITADQLSATFVRAGSGSFADAFTITRSSGVTVHASDDFERAVASGFGTAPVGGPWSLSPATANYAVAGGVGTIRLGAGAGLNANLPDVSASDIDLAVTMSTDKGPTGGGVYTSVIGRRVGTAGSYRAKARLRSTGEVSLSLVRTGSTGAETVISPDAVIPGLTYTLGDLLKVRVQVTGASPTTVQARVWELGMPEPSTWQRSTTDATAGLQSSGSIGVHNFLAGTATNAPITVRLDDLLATSP